MDVKACRIYNIRPLICRFYPFSLRKGDNGYRFEISEECPGIGLGSILKERELERMVEEARVKLKST